MGEGGLRRGKGEGKINLIRGEGGEKASQTEPSYEIGGHILVYGH